MLKFYKYFVQMLCLFSLYGLFPLVISAQDSSEDTSSRPKIGLVLSGGGARGAAHIGVLKVLEENHIPVDMIAGTSSGAMVGGLYALGYSPSEIEDIIANIDWEEIFSSQSHRHQRSFRRKQDDADFLIKFKIGYKGGKLKLPSGLVEPHNLRLTLRDLVESVGEVKNFDNLPIPFRAVATDLETGRAVVLATGNLGDAMVASMAVPALFPPVEWDRKLLVDGGVANNVPIDVARAMGTDIVIVVDISSPLMKKEEITSFTAVIDQLTMLMTHQTSSAQLATLTDRDILIVPELGGTTLLGFDRLIQAIPIGVASANKVLQQLQSLSLSPEIWHAHKKNRTIKSEENPVIDFIHIVNNTQVADGFIRAHLSQELGQKLDPKALTADLTTLYGLELFEEINYSIIEENSEKGIGINARSLKNGEDFFRFNLALHNNFEGKSGYQLALGYNNLAMNKLGGEWKTIVSLGDKTGIFTELYQPLDYRDRFYMFANTVASQFNRDIIDSKGILLLQVRISTLTVQLGGGVNFGQWGSFRTGLHREFGKVRGRIGFPDDKSIPYDRTTFTASMKVDTLDNIEFPHSGISFDAIYSNNLSWLNGEGSVDKIQIDAYLPFSWQRNTLAFNTNFYTSFNGTPDETDLFSLGGFLRLTAFAPGQLTGNHGGTAAVIYYRRIAGSGHYLTNMPIYLGTSFEAGNVWNEHSDISLGDLRWSSSLFLGADTLIGPVYLGSAIGTGGQISGFLYVGQIF